MKKSMRKAGIVLFWIIAWEGLAILCDNRIMLASPVDVAKSIGEQVITQSFWQSMAGSFAKISMGFVGAFLLAFIMAILSFGCELLEEFLAPVLQVMKSVPVASLVVLLLIWTGSRMLSFWIVFLIVFPLIYFGVLEGLKNTDTKMKELAHVYGMSMYNRLIFLYRPVVFPFLISSCKSALGMSWKAGIAAEVIGVPELSIGERIYMSKIYLDTANLFAWTIVIIVLSYLFEHSILFLLKKVGNRKFEPGENKPYICGMVIDVELTGVRIGYDMEHVLADINGKMKGNKSYGVVGASGNGKTTFLCTLLGLMNPIDGTVIQKNRASVVFQEDRLFEKEDAVTNVWMMCKKQYSKDVVEESLSILIGREHIHKPACELSGGMKRRVCVCRAMLADTKLVLMDEPFTGMDETSKKRTIGFIKEHLYDRIFVFTTHNEMDLQVFQAERLEIGGKVML